MTLHASGRALFRLAVACTALLLGACAHSPGTLFGADASPLRVTGSFKPATVETISARRPITLRVQAFEDMRDNAPSPQIGEIQDTFVAGISGRKIVIDEAVSKLVTSAMQAQLAAHGYRILETGAEGAAPPDFVVSGRIKHFSLDVKARDKANLQVQTTLADGRSGEIVWSGTVHEKTERFAGVMGDNRKSVIAYLDESLQHVTKKTADAMTAALTEARPALFLQAGPTIPGVKVEVAAPAAPEKTAVNEKGTLAIETRPEGAQVYIGDVYYGIAPLRLSLAPGVYAVKLEAAGYETVQQKVSVRAAQTTQWTTALKKQP